VLIEPEYFYVAAGLTFTGFAGIQLPGIND